jgi:hypothetical protein
MKSTRLVKTMMEGRRQITASSGLLGLKAQLLRLPRLALYDQYAPIANDPDPFCMSKPGRFQAFEASRRPFAVGSRVFRQGLIDAEIRKGNTAAHSALRLRRSCILHPLQLHGQVEIVMTVAHELARRPWLFGRGKLFEL